MKNARSVEASAAAQDCCAPAAKSGWLTPGNLLISAALAGGSGALVLGWDWLVAAGLASIILAVAPCLVMCALGLCMHRMVKNEQTSAVTPPPTPGPDIQAARAEPATPGTDARAANAGLVGTPGENVSGSRT